MRPLIYPPRNGLSRCFRPRPLMPREAARRSNTRRARGALWRRTIFCRKCAKRAAKWTAWNDLSSRWSFPVLSRAASAEGLRRCEPRRARACDETLRGRLDMAIGLGGLGAWLLGLRNGSLLRMFKSSGGRGARKVSCVRSAMIEMELDHESGKMRGTVLAGPDEGKSLDALTRPQCETLNDLCCRADPEGARLIEAYLDRRFAGWRAAAQNQRDPGRRSTRRRAGAMSEDEAYEVLGLQKGAPEE